MIGTVSLLGERILSSLFKNLFLHSMALVLQILFVQNLAAQELLSNGSFEQGETDWNNLAADGAQALFSVSAGDAADGSHALKVSVIRKGSNPWSVQSIHGESPLTVGTFYTLSFYGKSDADGKTLNVVIQNAPNVPYLARSFSLTTIWQKYEWTFAAAEPRPQVKFQYPNEGTYTLDQASLKRHVELKRSFTVTPGTSYQTMAGFGGGLTWYADRITLSPRRDEMIDLLIKDAGIDLIRFKNWYYPAGYPAEKSPTTMEQGYFKGHFDATNQLYDLIKAANPKVEFLLSSWTPPRAFKSNGSDAQGTLKRYPAGPFMYSELAQYYSDVLDHLSFHPDYFSFQNEPGFITGSWSTCEWRPTETADFPGYEQGLDAVYEALKERPTPIKILGPETENIGRAVWDGNVNTFRSMANGLKNKPYVYGYAYHLYNFAGSPNNISAANLNMIRDEFKDKPNFMTEFSSEQFDWLQVADVIHQTVVEAQASAYFYWDLMWDENSKSAILKVDATGNYTIGDPFYALKHYARFIDKGYKRIDVAGSSDLTKIAGFMDPEGRQIVLVAINSSHDSQEIELKFAGAAIAHAVAYQSVVDSFFQALGSVDWESSQFLPAQSLTTFVIDLAKPF